MATATKFLEDVHAFESKPLDIRECMSRVSREFGKSYASQLREIARLGRGDGKLRPHDYYCFRLYDDAAHSFESKRTFLSERIHRSVVQKCCDLRWWAAADDKFLTYAILAGCGAPIPETLAVYSHGPRSFGRIPKLATVDALAAFLAAARYPIFAKPIEGIWSCGAYRLREHAGGELVLHDGATISVADFARRLDAEQGYLFQSVLEPHPELRKFGDIVSTVRIILILEDGGPQILHTLWKIPAKGNFADNFWRSNNMIASVDTATGTVTRVVRGVGPAQEEIVHHPDTGAPIQGIVLPDWPRLVDLCLSHAGVFGRLSYQSWDIAMCPEGPVAVEVNTGSAFNLSQVAKGEGFLTERFGAFLARHGFPLKTRKYAAQGAR
jgi:hypothetical protein